MPCQIPMLRAKTRRTQFRTLALTVTLAVGLALSGCDRITQMIDKGAGSGTESAPPVEKFTYRVNVRFDDESKKLMSD